MISQMATKSSWSILHGEKDTETTKNRDVYNDQQLERGTIRDKQTMTSRIIVTAVLSVLATIATFLVIGLINYGTAKVNNTFNSATDQVTKRIGGAKENRLMLNPDSAGDGNSTISVTLSYYKPKGYYITTMGGTQLTKCVRKLNDVPLQSNWQVINSNKYGFKHTGKQGAITINTIGRIKKGLKAKGNTAQNKVSKAAQATLVSYLFAFSFYKIFFSLAAGILCYALLYEIMKRNLKVQNATKDTKDINQYHDDRHVTLPEEMMRSFEPFPDAGAHSWIQPSSLISHVALKNKGLKQVMLTQRYSKKESAQLAKQGINIPAGTPKVDKNGNRIQKSLPMMDTDFMEQEFDASGNPKDKKVRIYYDATKIPFKPENVGDVKHWKDLGVKTVADVINKDWTLPDYEVQRPGGAYYVDTLPVNTMVC